MALDTYLIHADPPIHFKAGEVNKQDLLKLIEACRWAPSADNLQVWRFVVVESPAIKIALRNAIQAQDSRLTSAKNTTPALFTSEDLDKMKWSYNFSYYDSKVDPYQTELKEVFSAEYACVESAGALVVCTFQPQFIGRAFGEVELGGAVFNLYLMAIKLGYRARIIRNFNRDLIKKACQIPDLVNIPAIIALGAPVPEESGTTLQKKDDEGLTKQGISLVDMILDRRSIRNYVEKKIPEDMSLKIQHLLEKIPTFTRQKYIDCRLITDVDTLQKIAHTARIAFVKQKQVGKAPAIVTISYEIKGASGYYGKMDVGMVFQAIMMEAYSLGVGTCWVGAFHHKSVREILGIPDGWRIEGIITMGYPNEYPQPPPRLPIANLAFQEIWDAPLTKNRVSRFARQGLSSLIRRIFKSTETKTILRERDAGQPLVPAFKELYDSRVSRGKMV